MENVIIGTKDNLPELIAQDKTTIVDFWAEWCGPCRNLGPVLDDIAKEDPNIQIVKVNVEDNSELSVEYGVRGIPAVFIYRNGQQINKFVGFKPKDDIKKLL
jgi:thioredoxin 1